jgi:FkbM family methyltransferase
LLKTKNGEAFLSDIEKIKNSNNKKIIFGAGLFGNEIYRCFCDVNWDLFIDNNPKTKTFCGLDVLTIDEYTKKYNDLSNAYILISSSKFKDEIYTQLTKLGCPSEHIFNFIDFRTELMQLQYFDYFKLEDFESFVDAGVCDGFTAKNFIKSVNNRYNAVYCFEPDEENFKTSTANLSEYKNVNLINAGLFCEDTVLSFQMCGNGTSSISESGTTSINVVALDNALKNKPVTFIKMDIEGAELDALKGAAGIIKNNKPKLAISIYHKPEDIFELPKMVLSLNPEYKLGFRHYSLFDTETIMYAE